MLIGFHAARTEEVTQPGVVAAAESLYFSDSGGGAIVIEPPLAQVDEGTLPAIDARYTVPNSPEFVRRMRKLGFSDEEIQTFEQPPAE
jgi:hypothetical protein